MKTAQVWAGQDTLLYARVLVADRFWSRARGLLGRPPLAQGEGLLLQPCNQVHTFFMRWTIGVVHVARDGHVLRAYTLPPNRIGPLVRGTAWILEVNGQDPLPAPGSLLHWRVSA